MVGCMLPGSKSSEVLSAQCPGLCLFPCTVPSAWTWCKMSYCLNSFIEFAVWGSARSLQCFAQVSLAWDFGLHIGDGQWATCGLDLDGVSMVLWLTALPHMLLHGSCRTEGPWQMLLLVLGLWLCPREARLLCCCSCLGETRRGLDWFGFRGAGCWICAVDVVLGWFPLQGLGVTNQGSSLCFTRDFTAELWFWAAVGRLFWWKKGSMAELLCLWCPETEMTDEWGNVIQRDEGLGPNCAKLCVEGGGSISESGMWMSVLGYWRKIRACLGIRVFSVRLCSGVD